MKNPVAIVTIKNRPSAGTYRKATPYLDTPTGQYWPGQGYTLYPITLEKAASMGGAWWIRSARSPLQIAGAIRLDGTRLHDDNDDTGLRLTRTRK